MHNKFSVSKLCKNKGALYLSYAGESFDYTLRINIRCEKNVLFRVKGVMVQVAQVNSVLVNSFHTFGVVSRIQL